MTKIAGSGSETGSISQRHGSTDPDPDPHQNVMDPEHWFKAVRFHMNLFYIKKGFYSRTETGEREIEGKTAHIMNAVGNRTCLAVCPAPLPPSNLIRGVSWSPGPRRYFLSHLLTSPLPPPTPLLHWDNFQQPPHILSMASNLEVVSMMYNLFCLKE
jgi:hypothetical protein